jgi:hypothetical protein
MSGPTDFHARTLLLLIGDIEEHAERALSVGHAPLVDAVEMAKILRALVSGAREYKPNEERLMQRFELAKTRGLGMSGGFREWGPAHTTDENDDAECAQ